MGNLLGFVKYFISSTARKIFNAINKFLNKKYNELGPNKFLIPRKKCQVKNVLLYKILNINALFISVNNTIFMTYKF